MGVLELTALPSIGEDRWVPWVREADVLLVGGGEATYVCHWMRGSGLADLLPSARGPVVWDLAGGYIEMQRYLIQATRLLLEVALLEKVLNLLAKATQENAVEPIDTEAVARSLPEKSERSGWGCLLSPCGREKSALLVVTKA